MNRRAHWALLTAAFVMVAGVGGVLAQQAQAARDQDVLQALLVEVRGLRAAMERMVSVGPRVQLALGRLQLQEQRVNMLKTSIGQTSDRLQRLQAEEAQLAQQVATEQGRWMDISSQLDALERSLQR